MRKTFKELNLTKHAETVVKNHLAELKRINEKEGSKEDCKPDKRFGLQTDDTTSSDKKR